ncbi:AsmA family protein [Terasakiella sp. A23]|uniref:AsmA family protein n=1 Tax=Terasakiella sp. FCG-A23 TaxID=3080561 RepID=UPI00295585AE|nr:AsmA family protein [Terasakiella sp. A23]MDV7338511.1 AsmA family protein [Terasakiella sp. A23]
MGRIKLIVGGIFAVIVGGIVAGVAILSSMDFNQYKGMIAEEAKAATGRDLVIAGDLNLEISLSPKVRVDGVTFANASWGSRPEMVKLKSFAAEMKLLPLIFGDIHIVELVLIEPDILLETDKSGKGNWMMGEASTEKKEEEKSESASGGSLPAVSAVRIDKARFTYKDGQKGEETSIVIDTMQAKAADLNDPLDLLFKGSFNNHVVELTGQLGSPDALMSGDPLDVNLALKAAGAVVNVTGKIAEPAAGKGLNLAISAKSDNIAKLAELGGAKVGKVGPFEMAATVSDGDKSYKLGGLSIKIGQTDLSGDVTVSLANKKPYINVALASNRFALNDVLPQGEEMAEAAPAPKKETSDKPAKLFPKAPLPIEGLKAVNADVSFKAKKFILGDFALNNLSDVISLKDGKMTGQHDFVMGGGTFGGHINFDGRKLPANLDVDLTGKNLGLGKSLEETGVTDLIHGGATQMKINLKASGKSAAGLMASLQGKTLINVGEGKIKSDKVNFLGGDLVTGVLENILPSGTEGEFTPFACMVVNLDFEKGVADYDKRIAVQTNVMNISSSGNINLAKETLDIGIKPEPRGDSVDLGVNAGGIASMVRLTGPLSSPGIGIDALETAKAAMGVASAIATGGVSLLISGLTDKALSDSAPCDTALGIKSSQKKSSSGTTQKKEEKSDNPIGGLLNMLGGNK